MSNIDYISFVDLMRETNIDDPKRLQKILRRRTDLPQVSGNKPISRKDAESIVRGLTGHSIDWMKYKVEKRNKETDGPLIWSSANEIIDIVSKWFSQIPSESKVEGKNSYILGLASGGGFLQGDLFSEFVVNFRPGINVIIGDRGSGKSTVVNLLGTMSDSIGEETQALIQKLIGLLYPDDKNTQNDIANLNNRASEILKHYGIDKYGLFVYVKGIFKCYYADRKLGRYSFLSLKDQKWGVLEKGEFLANPSILFLEQGEVIRIAEDRDRKFYLNSILDAIYPDLFQKRAQIIPLMQELMQQHDKYQPNYKSIEEERIWAFLKDRYRELNIIKTGLNNKEFNLESQETIQSYLDHYYHFLHNHSGRVWAERPVVDFLQEEDDEVLYYLYIFKISGFLRSKLKTIRRLIVEENLGIDQQPANDALSPTKNNLTQEAAILSEVLTSEQQNPIDIEISDNREDLEDIVDDTSFEEDDIDLFIKEFGPPAEANLFLDAVNNLEKPKISQEFYEVVYEVEEFLRNRLKALRNWLKIYRRKHEDFSSSLESLSKNYIALLRYKINVLVEQEKKCNLITELLNKDNLAVNITTLSLSENLEKLTKEIDGVASLEAKYKNFMNANVMIKLVDLFAMQEEYDGIINEFHNNLYYLHEQLESDNRDYLFYPLKIEYRQGNVFREFHQLSFGQKSGIILKMVLTTTEKSSIIIDQPEDNLDAFSIINIIAPSLNKLCSQDSRQIILVTHNPSLVLELDAQNLTVLESRGETGRVKFQGSLSSQEAVRELFDILEGGIQTFGQKIKTYEEFVGTIKGQIRDMDIQLLESSFRKRTIDGLRNYLQPIVSDGSLLDFLRHQLKQWNPEIYREQIKDFIAKLEKLELNSQDEQKNLLQMLSELTSNLENHIQRFQNAIDEIRLMDTQPKTKECNLFSLIQSLVMEDYLDRLRQSRRIEISVDENFREVYVLSDPNHLKLVIRNLISNSLRATESMAINFRKEKNVFIEKLQFTLGANDKSDIQLLYTDNGGGIPSDIRNLLYKEPCSTKPGKDHGLGGIIIRKLLEINNGKIDILDSDLPNNKGTVQKITLKKAALISESKYEENFSG